MSLILCRQEPVTVPLYIEDLGIHLYSSQELCYVIYNNPLLVLEGFIDKRLTEFLRSELRMPFLAERVEKWMDSHGATEEILYLILKECNYYTPKEQAAYRQTVNGLKKLSEEEYEKRRADYFYGLDLFRKSGHDLRADLRWGRTPSLRGFPGKSLEQYRGLLRETLLLPESYACLRECLECEAGGGVCETHVLPHDTESGAFA